VGESPGLCRYIHRGPEGIITDFTIVNYHWIINTLVSAKFSCLIHPEIFSAKTGKIAAKPVAKSVSINIPEPYCMFTTVNRNEAMNIYHAYAAQPAAVPEVSGIAGHGCPGSGLGRPGERFSGIRSSGQYCCQMELTGTGMQMTARRGNRGRTAVDGMCLQPVS
jgi:hypothetical protein